jgi:hypothetical protein
VGEHPAEDRVVVGSNPTGGIEPTNTSLDFSEGSKATQEKFDVVFRIVIKDFI